MRYAKTSSARRPWPAKILLFKCLQSAMPRSAVPLRQSCVLLFLAHRLGEVRQARSAGTALPRNRLAANCSVRLTVQGCKTSWLPRPALRAQRPRQLYGGHTAVTQGGVLLTGSCNIARQTEVQLCWHRCLVRSPPRCPVMQDGCYARSQAF
jgi:hypothetical protein